MSVFRCIFDPSHKLQSQQKLIYHMKKCKAQQKQSYECCKYNQLHWVKWNKIGQHQQKCDEKVNYFKKQQQKINYTKLLPDSISRIQFQMPFDPDVSVVMQNNPQKQQKNQNNQNNQNVKNMKKIETINKKKYNKAIIQQKKQPKLWQQPDFGKFLIQRGYKVNKQIPIQRDQFSFLQHDSSLRF